MPSSLNIAGQTFGQLTALLCIGVTKHRHRVWLCRCCCGSEHRATSNALRFGQVKSCGCRPAGAKRGLYTLRNATLSRMKCGARDRGLEWAISDAVAFDLMATPCHWCDSNPANRSARPAHSTAFFYSGIDRVDNARGYVAGNVVPCCAACNWMKRHLHADQFLAHVERIYLHNKAVA